MTDRECTRTALDLINTCIIGWMDETLQAAQRQADWSPHDIQAINLAIMLEQDRLTRRVRALR